MTDVLIEVQLISMHSNRILSSYNPKIINNRLQFQIHRNTLEMYAHKYINLIVDIYDNSYKMFTTILSQINCSEYLNDRIIGLRIQILKNTWDLLFFSLFINLSCWTAWQVEHETGKSIEKLHNIFEFIWKEFDLCSIVLYRLDQHIDILGIARLI